MTTISEPEKIIFILGATGAQGLAVVDAFLAPTPDGKPSPWRVRALSRNLEHRRVKELQERGVEFVQGSFLDDEPVERGMKGAYGAFVNTDGNSWGAIVETHAGIRVWELAQRAGVKHFVYSGLDYPNKLGNWDPLYDVDHYHGKARVVEYLKAQPSKFGEGPIWSSLLTGPYMDMLSTGVFAPLNVRDDGTVVFGAPLGSGKAPLIALSDLGWWARYIFDSPVETSGKIIPVASQLTSVDDIVEAFQKVTGKKAVNAQLTPDQWMDLFTDVDVPMNENTATTYRQNFSRAWHLWSSGLIKRDMEWIRSVHPDTLSVEQWMRDTGYTGEKDTGFKEEEDNVKHGMSKPDPEKLKRL